MKLLAMALTGLMMCGCMGCGYVGPEEHKRVWIMSDTENIRFGVQELDGHLSMIRACDYAPMYVGLHADIDVRWDESGDFHCYLIDNIRPLKDSK